MEAEALKAFLCKLVWGGGLRQESLHVDLKHFGVAHMKRTKAL